MRQAGSSAPRYWVPGIRGFITSDLDSGDGDLIAIRGAGFPGSPVVPLIQSIKCCDCRVGVRRLRMISRPHTKQRLHSSTTSRIKLARYIRNENDVTCSQGEFVGNLLVTGCL